MILLILGSPSKSLKLSDSFKHHRSRVGKQLNVLPKDQEKKFRQVFPQLFPSVSPSVSPTPSVSASATPTTSPTPSLSASSSSTPTKSPSLSPSITPSKSPSPTPFRNKKPQPSQDLNTQRIKIGSLSFSVPTDGSETNNEVKLVIFRAQKLLASR